jgi:hypothetical protein
MKKIQSNMSRDFQKKSALRAAFADGGSVAVVDAVNQIRARQRAMSEADPGGTVMKPAVQPLMSPTATPPVVAAPQPVPVAPAPQPQLPPPARVFGVPLGGPVGTGLRKLGFANGGMATNTYLHRTDKYNQTGDPAASMADGGEVRGPGGPREDKVPARGPGGEKVQLSDGEYVLPKKTVDAMGGPEELDELVRQTNDGREPGPEFKEGVAHAASGWGLKKALSNTAAGEATMEDFVSAGGTSPQQGPSLAERTGAGLRRAVDAGKSMASDAMGKVRATAGQAPEVLRNAAGKVQAAAAPVVRDVSQQVQSVADNLQLRRAGLPQVTEATMADFDAARGARPQAPALNPKPAAPGPQFSNVAAGDAAKLGDAAAGRTNVSAGRFGGRMGAVTAGEAPAATAAVSPSAPAASQASRLRTGAKFAGKALGVAGVAAPTIYDTFNQDADAEAKKLGVNIDYNNYGIGDAAKEFGVRTVGALRNLGSALTLGFLPGTGEASNSAAPPAQPPATPPTVAPPPFVNDPGITRIGTPGAPGASTFYTNDKDPQAALRRTNELPSGGIAMGGGYDLNLANERRAKANAIIQDMIDSQRGSPSEFRDTSAAAETDAFGKTAAQRDAESAAFNDSVRGGNFMPAGLRAQRTAAMGNASEERRNAVTNATARERTAVEAGLQRRGQDVQAALGLRRDETDRRGQNIDLQRANATNQLAVARFGQEVAKSNAEAVDKDLTTKFGITDKSTPEERAAFNKQRQRIMLTVTENGVPWQNVTAGQRAQLMKLADYADQVDMDNATFAKWAGRQVGIVAPAYQSDNLTNYQNTGLRHGAITDTVTSPVGEGNADRMQYRGVGGRGPLSNIYGPYNLPDLEGTAQRKVLSDRERK